MKKLLFFITILCFGLSVNAQNRRYYCEVVGMFNNNMDCDIVISIDDVPFSYSYDYGKIIVDGNRLARKNGKAFVSLMDAVNYMSHQGWQLLQVYFNSIVGSTHYVMYKDAISNEKAFENIWIGSGGLDYGQFYEVRPLVGIVHWNSESEVEE